MRIYLFLFVLFFFSSSHASLEELIAAVKADDVKLAIKILSEVDCWKNPETDVNAVEIRTQRRAIHYARSENMMRLLFANGAALHDCHRQLYTDSDGFNPLHVLFAQTAAELRREFKDEFQAMRQIEAAAYTLLIAFRQEVGAGWITAKTPIELQRDQAARIPVEYLRGPLWRADFIERLYGENGIEYRLSAEESEAIQSRLRARERELYFEDRMARDIERLKARERAREREDEQSVVLLQPAPTRPFSERPRLLCSEFVVGNTITFQTLAFWERFGIK